MLPKENNFIPKSSTIDRVNPDDKIRSSELLTETNEYKILAVGPFCKLIHHCSEISWLPQFSETVALTIEKWKQAVASNPKTYAGPQFRLEGFEISGDTLALQTSLISYNLYVGCRDEKKLSEIASANKIKDVYDLAAQPLNVSALIVFSDQLIPVQKRSLEVDVDPGMIYLPGGQLRDHLAPETIDLAKQRGLALTQILPDNIRPEELYVYREIERHATSPLGALFDQIISETGISIEHFTLEEAVLLGLIQAKGVALHPELVFLISCNLTSKEAMKFKGKDAWEGKFHLVNSDPNRIVKEINAIGNPVPIVQGALAVYTHLTSK